jgi:hypothetical protein
MSTESELGTKREVLRRAVRHINRARLDLRRGERAEADYQMERMVEELETLILDVQVLRLRVQADIRREELARR